MLLEAIDGLALAEVGGGSKIGGEQGSERVREGAYERGGGIGGHAVFDVEPEEEFNVRGLEPYDSGTVDEARGVDRKFSVRTG